MSEDKRYLGSGQLARRYERTTRTISRWIENPPDGFPLPVRINGRHFWDAEAIEAWEQSLAANIRQPAMEAA